MSLRVVAILVLSTFGPLLPAQADMIEIKDRGVLNGKILSQDDKEVRFEDSTKNLFVIPKKDVLFLEVQTDRPLAAQTRNTNGRDWGSELDHWKYKAQRVFRDAKVFVLKNTKKIRKLVNAPLDRSSADSRSNALAASTAELSSHSKTLNKQGRKKTSQLKGVKDDQMHATIKTKSRDRSGGTFSSLD